MHTQISIKNRFGSAFLMVGFALGLLVSPSSAQVEYVRELIGTVGIGTSSANSILSATQSQSGQAGQIIVTVDGYFVVNGTDGTVADKERYPQAIHPFVGSLVAYSGQGSPQTPVSMLGGDLQIFTVNAEGSIATVPAPLIPIDGISLRSLALSAQNAPSISLISDSIHYMVNVTTGVPTATTMMSTLDASEAFYQSYGQDGNLYVLDYGNQRMASFDPTTFAPLGGFDLNTDPEVTTANVQFAIGSNGSFYLGDGLGGGTYYNSAGLYQGAFRLESDTIGDPYTGASYVSTDADGFVYVYDSATGFHQYRDISVVPEPSTYMLAIAALLGFVLLGCRQASLAPIQSRQG